jgi:hypothetical protein
MDLETDYAPWEWHRRACQHWLVIPCGHESLVLGEGCHEVGLGDDCIRVSGSFRCCCRSQSCCSSFRFLSSFPLCQGIGRNTLHTENLDVVPIPTGKRVGQTDMSLCALDHNV